MIARLKRFAFVTALCAACTAAGAQNGKAPLKGPYLQYKKDPSARSITIAWETQGDSTGYVQFAGRGQRARKVSDKKRARHHEVSLTNLKPGVRYTYRLGGDVSGGGTFTVPKRKTDSVRFVVIGDPRSYDRATKALLQHVIKDKPDLLAATGDYIHRPNHPTYANWVQCFQTLGPLLKDVPFFPSVGDHDDGDGAKEYREHFALPGNELWYSYDWGNCHFISLRVTWNESLRPGTEQYKWLENDLKRAAGKYDFIFAYYHLPMITVGHYGKDKDNTVRAYRYLRPLFKKYGVQASFGGHDHNYQHWELDGHTFVVTGGFNSERLYKIEQKSRAKREIAAGRLKKAERVSHYVLVEVKGKKAKYTVKGENGQVLDTFTIKSIRR